MDTEKQQKFIKLGFLIAGLANIGGVLLFSKFFSNTALSQADPVVFSNFGLVMIMVWGLAYIAVGQIWQKAAYLSLVFAVEKLVYVVMWYMWISSPANSLTTVAEQDFLAGQFFKMYGPNDALFMFFFIYVFFVSKKNAK